MSKIIILLLSLVITNVFKVTDDNYQLVMVSNNTYLNSYMVTTDFHLDYNESIYELYCKENKINIKADKITISQLNDELYLFRYLDKKLELIKYNKLLQKLNQEMIYEGEIYSDLIVCDNGNDVYLMYNNHTKNIYGFSFGSRDNQFMFDGNMVSTIKKAECVNNYLYLILTKDNICANEFGNGGTGKSTIIAVVNDFFEIEKFITLSINEEIKELWVNGEYIYSYIGSTLYLFLIKRDELNKINKIILFNKLNLEEYKQVVVGENGLIFSLVNNEIVLYDSISFFNIKAIKINDGSQIKLFNDCLYMIDSGNGYIMDVINTKKIKSNYFEVYSLFGKCKLISKTYLENYSFNIFGKYNTESEYTTSSGLSFIVQDTEEIKLLTNVKNNMIYPMGYRLFFNGVATLDGVNIVNNYPVNIEGNHILVIKGNDNEETINFQVSTEQIEFIDEETCNGDFDILINSDFNISFECENINTNDIINIVLTGADIKKYEIKNNNLIITINGFTENGQKKITLEKIEYNKVLNQERNLIYQDEIYLNKEYIVNVYSNSYPSISLVDIENDLSLIFDVQDGLNQLRVLELEIVSNNNNKKMYFPLGNHKLVVSGLEPGEYKGYFRILYNNYKNEYDKLELYSFEITIKSNSFQLGEVVINKYVDSINMFTIKIDKQISKELTKLSVNNQEIVISDGGDFGVLEVVIYSIISFSVLLICGVLTKKLILKKKK